MHAYNYVFSRSLFIICNAVSRWKWYSLSSLQIMSLGGLQLCAVTILIGIDRNRMLSLEILPYLEPALYQPQLIDDTFHAHLLVEIMQEPLAKCPLSLIILQDLCSHMRRHSHYPGP